MKDYITYLKFDDYDEETLFKCFQEDIEKGNQRVIVTPNLDFLRFSYKNKRIREMLNKADYSTIDGKPILKLAKKEKKHQFKHKISGSDMINDLLPLANEKGWRIVIVGGKPGVGEKAKTNILKKYSNVVIGDVICPEFGFEKDGAKTKSYVEMINNAKPNAVLLCLGSPKQEFFYFDNKKDLCSALFFCVGATVDFLAGTVKRSPKWMSRIGMEWFYRMTKDFKRLFPRYWLDFWFLVKLKFMCTFRKNAIKKLINDN